MIKFRSGDFVTSLLTTLDNESSFSVDDLASGLILPAFFVLMQPLKYWEHKDVKSPMIWPAAVVGPGLELNFRVYMRAAS